MPLQTPPPGYHVARGVSQTLPACAAPARGGRAVSAALWARGCIPNLEREGSDTAMDRRDDQSQPNGFDSGYAPTFGAAERRPSVMDLEKVWVLQGVPPELLEELAQ